ncbi:MAG: type III polyketide synthase [Candidatus Scalindua sp.]|jgi:predicted naringenin-chalcone synthase|nr:type III polyketide synthase [Candidatus Scalindua sp.]MBT6225301.1 type III polyketide synthase [Candidatus Scalindua sp.]MBT6564831.1 type III polyketide synthase [Candidatus Scalindua sp.]MBT7211004.1 type III polyketide synthase [Candidatus Scalindua sp.]MBT7590628.1 type III polyketide synthase [Candidatus Scalindua sp.]
MKNESVSIASLGLATPPYAVKQSEAEAFLRNHYSKVLEPKSLSKMIKIFAHPSVLNRYIAVKDLECLVNEDQESRITRFTHWAVELSSQAIKNALVLAEITTDEITGLVVNTCTGYICPGISTYLLEKLGLSNNIRIHDLVGSGCGGAIPNLQVCRDMIQGNRDEVVVSVSVEICTATFQMADDLSLIVSNALFADGASAAVLWSCPGALKLVASASRCNTRYREDIRYIYRNGQLHNQLSLQLSEFASKTVATVVNDLLTPRGLKQEDINHWAFHPGGEKVINAIRDELGISEIKLQATRDILAGYGNMSSPTVLFVLREILSKGVAPGDWCVIVAFGAGLSAHGFLLKA